MTYKGNSGSIWFILLAVFSIQLVVEYSIYYIFLTIFILLLAFMSFALRIVDNKLIYKATIFGITFYKKTSESVQITELKLKRAGWAKKCAIVKVKDGLNLRIIDFHPNSVYDELQSFAEKHGIRMVRTKNYELLTKMRWSSGTE
ncbi:hypothetical protein [Virgibacillus doumboii]|uniref:hypothetical protein n=1 Tax=Virgibacillus doumboii TaxID=2697503 RepID=UPI0013DE962A|nr:hypothetical protein [Virgibacillus doumboii]